MISILRKTQKPIRNEPKKGIWHWKQFGKSLSQIPTKKRKLSSTCTKKGEQQSICALNALRQLFKEKVMKNILRSADGIPLVLNAINLGGTFHLKASLVRLFHQIQAKYRCCDKNMIRHHRHC